MKTGKKKKLNLFATSDITGEKFVDTRLIEPLLVFLIDGATIVQFKGEKRTYLHLDYAISWVEKEMQKHSRERYEKVLKELYKFQALDLTKS